MKSDRTFTDQMALLIGQWFFTGRAPVGPGTVGSAGALPLFFLMRSLSVPIYWALTVGISLLGIAVSERCAKILGEKDPSSVVIDEVAGVLIALGVVRHGPLWVLGLAWVLFRALDIAKPWVIDRVQYLSPPGLGIMADDLLAGLVAGLLSWGVLSGVAFL